MDSVRPYPVGLTAYSVVVSAISLGGIMDRTREQSIKLAKYINRGREHDAITLFDANRLSKDRKENLIRHLDEIGLQFNMSGLCLFDHIYKN